MAPEQELDLEEGHAGEEQWKRYPRKPVTFPTQDHLDRATNFCKKEGVGFSELVRKLLFDYMRNREEMPQPAQGSVIRIIKEPSR